MGWQWGGGAGGKQAALGLWRTPPAPTRCWGCCSGRPALHDTGSSTPLAGRCLPFRPSFQATSVSWCFIPLSGPHSYILFPRKSLKALSLQMGKLTR